MEFYARISINGGALCLPISNNNKRSAFRTLAAAQARLEAMGCSEFYGYDKSKGAMPHVRGEVVNRAGQLLWSICL